MLLLLMFVAKLLKLMESSWPWWISTYLKGRVLAQRRPFDLIYSTGALLLRMRQVQHLNRATGPLWLAVVHDPLVAPGRTPKSGQERKQTQIEALICKYADFAIWFTEQALESARLRHPELGERGHMILSGADSPFVTLPPYERRTKMVVGHFGLLSAQRNLTPFFKASEFDYQQAPFVLKQIGFHITGGPLDEMSAAYLAGMSTHIKAVVKHFGRLDFDPQTVLTGQQQILLRMRSSDLPMLLQEKEPMCAEYITSKMYEYLWMQRPILATLHHNLQMDEMLRGKVHSVVTQDTDVVINLAKYLIQLYDRWSHEGLPDSGKGNSYTTLGTLTKLSAIVGAR